MLNTHRSISILVLCLWLLPLPLLADPTVWLTGRVTAEDGKSPVSGAMVAVYDQKNHVVDYARTDADGEYTLAVPGGAMNLGKSSGGLFYQVSRMVGNVGKLASLGLRAGIRVAADAANATADPLMKVGIGTARGIADTVAGVIGDTEPRRVQQMRQMPGALVIKVAAPGHRDVITVGRVYWMQEDVYRVDGREQRARVAWMDPARLAPANSEKRSTVSSDYLTFSEMQLNPGIAERGRPVTVSVRFATPPAPRTPFVVVARNVRSGQSVRLDKVGEDRYEGHFVIDRRSPRDDQVIAVLAYAEQDEAPGRDSRAEAALERAGFWNVSRPYVYNPLLVVSRNRGEAALTVVEGGRARQR